MGHLVRATSAGLVVEPLDEDGCHAQFGLAELGRQATRRARAAVRAGSDGWLTDVYALALDADSPLTPRAGRALHPERGEDRVRLAPGVYWVRRLAAWAEDYLHVDELSRARVVTKAEAYRLLGAVEALKAMGLDDAAVSLQAGDFDRASVQVIEERERRRSARNE